MSVHVPIFRYQPWLSVLLLAGCRLGLDGGAPLEGLSPDNYALCEDHDAYHWPQNGHCYVRHNSVQPFNAAAQACRSTGAFLVSYTSPEEYQAVESALDFESEHWIGLEGVNAWRWQSGEEILFDVWAPMHPVPGTNEVAGYVDAGGQWKSDAQGASRSFACEYPSSIFEQSRYQLHASAVTHELAIAGCQSRGGHLVEINSAQEHLALSQFWGRTFWIGASDRAVEGQWLWESGQPVDFSAWGASELTGTSENCAFIGQAGTWGDHDCNQFFPYLCEYPAATF